jgi:hypothetical protein
VLQGRSRYSLLQLASAQSRHAVQNRSPLPVGQLGRICNATWTHRRISFAAAFAEPRASDLLCLSLSHHLHTRCGGEDTSPQPSPASPAQPVSPASPVQSSPARARTPHDSLAVKRSSDTRHAQRRRPVGPRPGPSPQVHHPEPVRPGQTAAEPQEPALRRLPEAQDGLRDPL